MFLKQAICGIQFIVLSYSDQSQPMGSILRKHPFLAITLALILGILFSHLSANLSMPLFYFLFSMIALVVWINGIRYFSWPNIAHNPLVLLAFFLAGACIHGQRKMSNIRDHISACVTDGQDTIIGSVKEKIKNRCIISVDQINGTRSSGNLLVFYDNDFLRPGDHLYAHCYIKRIEGPKNPYVFDYSNYYGNKEIWHQGFFKEEPLLLKKEFNVKIWIGELREKCKKILRKEVTTSDEFALTSALLLGDKRELGDDLRNAFADTGAMHVLAVSGLHVGVLYMIIMFLLKQLLPSSMPGKILRSLVVLSGIWFFVYLVGAPISAWRAALMFSLFELGILLSRNAYPVNTLSVAAFVLLILDSYSLFDVGFQLSFLAVLGIVTCQKSIQKWIVIENPLLFRIWQLMTVSISAQLFIFPLTIYYFHQFPMYFWLSGIVAVPLAFALLTIGLCFFALHWIPYAGAFLGSIVFAVAWIMNQWILLVSSFPGIEALERLWISVPQLIILILMGAAFALWINYRNLVYAKMILCLVIVGLFSMNLDRMHRLRQQVIIFYHHWEGDYVDLFIGKKVYPILGDVDFYPKDIATVRAAMGATKSEDLKSCRSIYYRDGFLQCNNTSLYFTDALTDSSVKQNIPAEYIFIRNDRMASIEGLDAGKTVVLGSSLSYRGKYVESKLRAHRCSIINLAKDGSFMLDLTKSL